ncbi:MAG: helix-turn-helix domain-containing protein [Hyphomonadaceae bacterium JAD_PAG50586_4]|nr:MAG: helix-turn-helix domain-containing protein [Hyphomonadaceae bacterium JAD_PAG50586_4]
MAKPARTKSPGKRSAKRAAKSPIDPRQMGLFDTLEAAPSRMQRKRAAKVKAVRTGAPERPVVLSPGQAAQYLGVSVSTLKNWRAKNIGPKWTLRGARLVAYRPADLEKYLDDNSAKR